jgi:hypothetical protein
MSDFKLFQLAAMVTGLVLLWQVLAWIARSPQDRWVQLATIAEQEHLQSTPPQALLEQARWLLTARLLRLRGLSVVLGVALLIGAAEGLGWRRTDARGGFRFSLWVCGIILFVVLVGALAFSLVMPWALPLTWQVSAGLALYVGLMAYCCAAGLPHLS